MHRQGWTNRKIGAETGYSPLTVGQVINGHIFKHIHAEINGRVAVKDIPGPVIQGKFTDDWLKTEVIPEQKEISKQLWQKGMHKLTDEQTREIHRLYKQGCTQKEIAEQYSLTIGWTSQILRGHAKKHIWCEIHEGVLT